MPSTSEYPEPPFVSLAADAGSVQAAGPALLAANSSGGSDGFKFGLLGLRGFIQKEATKELVGATVLNEPVIRHVLDAVWLSYIPTFRRATGPMIAQAYFKAFSEADAGKVPGNLVFAMADEHAERIGKYFADTSADAVIQGFNTLVNRQVASKAAIARVMEAYGMSPKEMNGFTSAKQLQPKTVDSGISLNLKKNIQHYIANSIAKRMDLFQKQETHNLSQQAQQIAWMWMLDHGKLPDRAEKMWLTAADEKVCKQCGPMHRKKVGVNEKFELPNGNLLYVPGAHVNCRCEVRLQIPVVDIGKAFDPKEHPRGGNPKNRGQFSRYSRTSPDPQSRVRRPARESQPAPEVAEISPELQELQRVAEAQEVADRQKLLESVTEAPEKVEIELPTTQKVELELPSATTQSKMEIVLPTPKQRPDVEIELPTPAAEPKVELELPTEQPSEKVELDIRGDLGDIVDLGDWATRVGDRQTRKVGEGAIPMKPRVNRPTVLIRGPGRVPSTGTFVGFPNEADRQNSQFDVTSFQDVQIIPQQEHLHWLYSNARAAFDQKVNEKVNEIMAGNDFYTIEDEYEGWDNEGEPNGIMRKMEAILDRDEVATAVTAAALSDAPPPSQYGRTTLGANVDTEIAVLWGDAENGDDLGEDYPDAAIIGEHYLGVKPDDFRVHIFEMQEGYPDAAPVDKDHPTVWTAPGLYEMARRTPKDWLVDNQGFIPIQKVQLRPLVQDRVTFEEVENPWVGGSDDPIGDGGVHGG